MTPAGLWRARLALKTLRLDQRETIREAGEDWAAGLFFCA